MESDPDKWLTLPVKEHLAAKGYSLKSRIAHGAYGHVYLSLAKDQNNNGQDQNQDSKEVACKVMDLSQMSEKFRATFLTRELMVLVKIRHRFIISIFDIYKMDNKILIFMEYAPNGTLANFCKSYGPLSEPQCGIWFNQLCDAIYCLHDRWTIAHRDLKLENILLNANNCVKVTDFGFATSTLDLSSGEPVASKTWCGTRPYYAPEVASKQKYNPLPADIWSCGVVLYCMATNKFPFHFPVPSVSTFRLADMVAEQRAAAHRKKDLFRKLSSPIKEVIDKIFTFDSTERPTIYDVIEFDFLKQHPFYRVATKDDDSIANLQALKSIQSAASAAVKSPTRSRSKSKSSTGTDGGSSTGAGPGLRIKAGRQVSDVKKLNL